MKTQDVVKWLTRKTTGCSWPAANAANTLKVLANTTNIMIGGVEYTPVSRLKEWMFPTEFREMECDVVTFIPELN